MVKLLAFAGVQDANSSLESPYLLAHRLELATALDKLKDTSSMQVLVRRTHFDSYSEYLKQLQQIKVCTALMSIFSHPSSKSTCFLSFSQTEPKLKTCLNPHQYFATESSSLLRPHNEICEDGMHLHQGVNQGSCVVLVLLK